MEELEELVLHPDVDQTIFDEYETLSEELGSDGNKSRALAQKILHGLGFTNSDQQRPVSEFSGGWRMRISLARSLFVTPDILLLDEPTNHLDLHATLWLTDHLRSYRLFYFLFK